MINDFYYSSNQFNSNRISVAATSGFRSSVPSSIITNNNVGLRGETSIFSIGGGSSNNASTQDSKTCPIGQSQIVQELTTLHALLLQYLKNNSSPSNNKNMSSLNNGSVCFTTPTKYSSPLVCDLNFSGSRFTSNSYSSESISNPLLMSSSSSTSPYGSGSPVRSSIATTAFSSPTHHQPTYSNSSFHSHNQTLTNLSEYEERISRLEQLVKQILSLIYRGDYKSPTDSKTTTPSVQVANCSDSTNSIKQTLTSKIKETYQLDMEPLKQIVASVVHFEPKRLNMGYDIIFQMKTELSYLSQLCK